MTYFYYALGGVIAVILAILGVVIARKQSQKLNIYFKVLSCLIIGVFFFRFMLGTEDISKVNFWSTIPSLNTKGKVILGFIQD